MTKRPKKIRIAFIGGGTGGHIFPLIAVKEALAQEIADRGFDPIIRYFGNPGVFRRNLEDAGIRVSWVPSSKFRRYFDPRNLLDVFNFVLGFIVSLWKLFWFMPHACFSKGGPGALAITAACGFYTIPIVVHESDAVPGVTNLLTSKIARLVQLAFASARDYFPSAQEVHVVGAPVREEIIKPGEPRAAKIEFALSADIPVVLFLGGSQGAEKINSFILEHAEHLLARFQILHQVGRLNFAEYANQFNFLNKKLDPILIARYKFVPFFDKNIKSAYDAADVIVARSGSGTLFEIAANRKPAVLVPLPGSANNHQVKNAYEYERSGAGIVIEEENLLPGVLIDAIQKILDNTGIQEHMAAAADKFFVPGSARMIADDIVQKILKI
jgi:UDP-N-acetylglucosamine--N-acetylmuramyl-(pentapeptide) pyrophosphoryl-undecaprenol N-acetylglucosamine transferase